MADSKDSTDKVVYGVALAVAVIAAGIAIASGLSTADEETGEETGEVDPVAAARERAEREARGTSIELPPPRSRPAPGEIDEADVASARPLPPGFVPALPEVPDLDAEPPPARQAEDGEDPRMENLAAEMRILSRARTLLGEHPAEALGVIRQHQRQYPHGALREEREVFAIEALLALEHADEAERRYYDFLRDFPDSEHRAHLSQEMMRPPHRVGASGR
ncbi:MAG: hypothetical protein KC619_20890 [Myxococcales bacterium]|nr:hypothetical protein [Myxococcales bacterium]